MKPTIVTVIAAAAATLFLSTSDRIAAAEWNENRSWPPSRQGWAHPYGGGVLHSHKDFTYASPGYTTHYDAEHAGIDFAIPAGTPVVAIAAGNVLRVKNSSDASSAYVIVQHKHDGRTDSVFCAIYGHIAPSVRSGTTVTQGQTLGTVLKASTSGYWEPHLHFGINKNESGNQCQGNSWGRSSKGTHPDRDGFQDPLPFLNEHRWPYAR